jgi:Leucine-rich repeat (LRR) protein
MNISGNKIENIGTGLDSLANLRELNLSNNKIGNFKELLNLNWLPNLKVSCFFDPHYGENPICNLCNYQTYVLYHLPKLVKLDTLHISEDAKTFAEATFMKKRMYYNMRIKTIQRNSTNVLWLLKKAKLLKLLKLSYDYQYFSKIFHETSRELEERQLLSSKLYKIEEEAPLILFGPEKSQKNPLDSFD